MGHPLHEVEGVAGVVTPAGGGAGGGVVVDHGLVAADEADQEHPQRPRDVHGHRGGRRDADQGPDPGGGGFLRHLIARPPRAHQRQRALAGAPGLPPPAQRLVDGVVAPDVLADAQRRLVGPKERRGVQPPGLREERLLGAHRRQHRGEARRRHAQRRQRRWRGGEEGERLRAATDPAGGHRRADAAQLVQRLRGQRRGGEAGDVQLALCLEGPRADLGLGAQEPLGEEVAQDERALIAGRPHRREDGALVDDELERALDDHRLGLAAALATAGP
jgi:hypothetical protein